jgi:hypothetical protein
MRKVKLLLGPCDGAFSKACGDVLLVNGKEVYAYDGGADPDCFVHTLTLLRKLPRSQRRIELRTVGQWVQYLDAIEGKNDASLVVLPKGIPIWRLGAWMQIFRTGQLGLLRGSR